MTGRRLIILLGPTAVGKTDRSIELALRYDSPIISCDSRQLYREMSIGTAVPSREQLDAVRHYFIQDHSIFNVYTAGRYELEALELIEKLFNEGHETLVMTGGSMMYIDALCKGLDDFPAADMDLRAQLMERMRVEGLESLASELRILDPATCEVIDMNNNQRVVRALEVCLMTGRPFSSFKTSPNKVRNFQIEKIGLTRPRDVLYDRINRRVLQMVDEGLVEEARGLLPHKDLLALQTVGYREMFSYLEGEYSLDRAIELIQRNTRHYAKRQLTWWARDPEIKWEEL